jgi:hypothetical protein
LTAEWKVRDEGIDHVILMAWLLQRRYLLKNVHGASKSSHSSQIRLDMFSSETSLVAAFKSLARHQCTGTLCFPFFMKKILDSAKVMEFTS